MTFRALFLLLASLASLAPAQTAPGIPLHDGEGLTYRVSWAIVPGAGEIKISARQESSPGVERLIITSNTATRGLAGAIMPFKAEAQSIFDLRTGKLSLMYETSDLRAKHAEHMVIFDYEKREAHYTPMRDSKKQPAVLPMPPGDPMDLIVALMQTRNWNITPGEKRDMLVLWDDDFYELTLHAVGYEEVKTKLGTFKTLVLEPRMEKTPPKGMFRKGSTVRVWIAQDAHRLPVKFAVEFKIGTGTATLESYEPPAQPALGTAAAPRHGENPRS